jgi:hypothetical protein
MDGTEGKAQGLREVLDGELPLRVAKEEAEDLDLRP